MVIIGLICGCVTTRNVEKIELAQNDVVVTDIDGKFEFRSGNIYRPPVTTQCSNGFKTVFDNGDGWNFHDITYFANKLFAQKAADIGNRVIISSAEGNKKYGALLLCKIHPGCKIGKPVGPGAESYLLDIPNTALEQTATNEIVILYETVEIQGCTGGSFQSPSWILWMSNNVFW